MRHGALELKHWDRVRLSDRKASFGVRHRLQCDFDAALLGDLLERFAVAEQQRPTARPKLGARQNSQSDLGANAAEVALRDGDAGLHVAIVRPT